MYQKTNLKKTLFNFMSYIINEYTCRVGYHFTGQILFKVSETCHVNFIYYLFIYFINIERDNRCKKNIYASKK